MPVSHSAEVLALKHEDAAAVSKTMNFLESAPIGLNSLDSLVNLAKLTKTIGIITDFWQYIR